MNNPTFLKTRGQAFVLALASLAFTFGGLYLVRLAWAHLAGDTLSSFPTLEWFWVLTEGACLVLSSGSKVLSRAMTFSLWRGAYATGVDNLIMQSLAKGFRMWILAVINLALLGFAAYLGWIYWHGVRGMHFYHLFAAYFGFIFPSAAILGAAYVERLKCDLMFAEGEKRQLAERIEENSNARLEEVASHE